MRISSGCVHSLLPTMDFKGGPDGPQVPGASGPAEVTGPLFSPNNPSLALCAYRVTAHLPPFSFNRISRDCTGLRASGGQGSQTGCLPQLEGLQGRNREEPARLVQASTSHSSNPPPAPPPAGEQGKTWENGWRAPGSGQNKAYLPSPLPGFSSSAFMVISESSRSHSVVQGDTP